MAHMSALLGGDLQNCRASPASVIICGLAWCIPHSAGYLFEAAEALGVADNDLDVMGGGRSGSDAASSGVPVTAARGGPQASDGPGWRQVTVCDLMHVHRYCRTSAQIL